MRILIATDHYPPFIGGAHRQARLLATGMAGRGHDVAVATAWHGGTLALDWEENVSVHRLRQMRTAIPGLIRTSEQRHQPPFPDPVTILGLRGLIAGFEPEVIHAYGWLAFSVAVAMGRRRIPLLISARDYGYFCANRTLLRKGEPCSGPAPLKCLGCAADYYGAAKGVGATAGVYICKPLLARKMNGLHSVSSFVHDVTTRYLFGAAGAPAGLVEVTIPSFQETDPDDPIDSSDLQVRAILERLPPEPFILYVGAFRKVKGLETLFEAYRRIQSPPPLVLMGTYERDSPEHFPPEAIVFTDVPHPAVMAAWDRAMFGVMPSLWPEPFGATVAEAMNRGRPVIGTTLGGHVDMIGSSAGILVPQGDARALEAAMSALIREPKRREEYGRAAAERARSFAAKAVIPRFEQAYRDVLAASRGISVSTSPAQPG
jgi:glycosyltransferase involved in cell wall biosynthesis